MSDIVSVVNTLAENIYESIEKDVYKLLDELLYIDKNLLDLQVFKKLSLDSDKNTVILLALCFITMFLICFAIRRIIAMYTAKPSNTAGFILRIIICSTLAMSSYYICEILLDINFKISEVFMEMGEDVTGKEILFNTIKDVISSFGQEDGFISLNGAIKGMVGFGAISLLLNFCVRYVTVIFLVITAPLCFMMAINSSTFGIFTKWLKLLVINLFIQNITAIVIIIPLCISDTSSTVFKTLLVGSIYILYKINPFVSDIFSNLNITRGNNQ